MSSYTHVSFDSSIVWYLLKQILMLDANIAKEKSCHCEQKNEWFTSKRFIFSSPKYEMSFIPMWLFFTRQIFSYISLLHASLMVCRIGVTAEKKSNA